MELSVAFSCSCHRSKRIAIKSRQKREKGKKTNFSLFLMVHFVVFNLKKKFRQATSTWHFAFAQTNSQVCLARTPEAGLLHCWQKRCLLFGNIQVWLGLVWSSSSCSRWTCMRSVFTLLSMMITFNSGECAWSLIVLRVPSNPFLIDSFYYWVFHFCR